MKITECRLEVVQNGIVMHVTKKKENGKEAQHEYETMVFPNMETATEWVKENVHGKKIENGMMMGVEEVPK